MKYSKEFKEEAIRLSDEIGLKEASQQLNLQYYTLSDWRSKRNAREKREKSFITDNELRERNLELERENAELRKANEILKEALALVAEKRKNT
ncbi:MAG: transposase [Ruminococcus sp.]|jgi:transposase|uniref:transposase n=1 Tax=uncultured Ruminococcus sp. TaxID=165186 RepID=UPI0025CC8BC4|nr:transposase [uncultured Ruminococcus sp.]MBQ6212338.1 transposase [Ruminococcus sp.]